jgi:hypothetical protein
MGGFDWKSVLKTAAPLLGTAVGGPFGAAAGALIAKALGGDETKTTPDDLAKLVQNVTPEQLLALKNAEQEWAYKLKELDLDSIEKLEALAVQDRDSARKRQIELKDHTPTILAYGVTIGFFGLLGFMLKHEVPASSKDVLNILLGSLGTAWISIITFFFGSSAGSQKKDELLHKSKPSE